MPLDLHAETFVVLQRLRDFIEHRKRHVLENCLVPGEVDPLLQLELVPLDDELLVRRAAPVIHGTCHVRAVVHIVGDAIVVTVGAEEGLFVDGEDLCGGNGRAFAPDTGAHFKADAQTQNLGVAVVETGPTGLLYDL